MNLARWSGRGVSLRPRRYLQTARRCAIRASGRSVRCPICSILPCSTKSVSCPPCAGSSTDCETRSGLRVTLEAPPAMERLPEAIERDLFLVVQEALLNVVRHSGSDTAEVRVERQATQVMVQIRDDGPWNVRRRSPDQRGDWAFVGVGIPSMRERLRQNGGELEILSNHQGTTIIATVPFQAERDGSAAAGDGRVQVVRVCWTSSVRLKGLPLKYRVLVVEDHEWWRRYISSALEQASQWEVVGAVSDGIEAVQKARDLKPDVILLDVGLPGMDGIQAARQMLAHDPSSRILFVSEQQSLDIAEAALGTGARGYIVKSDVGRELLPAMKAVIEGERFISAKLAGRGFETTTMGGSCGRFGATKLGSMRTNHRSWMTMRGLPKPRWLPGTASSWWSPVHDVTGFISDCRRAASTSTAPSRRGDVFGVMCDPLCRASSSTIGLTKHDSGTPRALVIMEAARGSKRDPPRVSVCGDGAATLLQDGLVDAAIRLEQLWDDVARTYNVDIFCPYPSHVLRCDDESQVFRDLRAAHSAVYVR